MTISDLFALLGGLGLFFYGMKEMRCHLETAAVHKMKKILQGFITTPLRGFLAGIGITASVQSSTAVTVLAVGFVDSNVLLLKQAVWIILGANIGTTITGQIITLDLSMLAPVIIVVGLFCLLIFRKEKWVHLGGFLIGIGAMFVGLDIMEIAMNPLAESEFFYSILTICKNPFMGICVGTIFTALIQSSTASVGILQSLAKNGLVSLEQCMYLIFGQNIGTCFTALLSSVGTKYNAKRTAVIHLLINVLGVIFFMVICYILPVAEIVVSWSPGKLPRQIANVHTMFNIISSLILLPFSEQLVRISKKIVPEK